MPTIESLILMFTTVNEDSYKVGDVVVELTNHEFYTDQIFNLYDVTYEQAKCLAIEMSKA